MLAYAARRTPDEPASGARRVVFTTLNLVRNTRSLQMDPRKIGKPASAQNARAGFISLLREILTVRDPCCGCSCTWRIMEVFAQLRLRINAQSRIEHPGMIPI